jgi:predicted PurR-regulated permease PerM
VKDPNSKEEPLHARNPLEWMRWVPLTLLALAFCAAVFIGARIILVPMLCSLALAYLLAPVVAWFERRGWSRSSSVLLTISGAAVALALILIFILPGFWGQLVKTYDQARERLGDKERVESLRQKVGRSAHRFTIFWNQRSKSLVIPTCLSAFSAWLASGCRKVCSASSTSRLRCWTCF